MYTCLRKYWIYFANFWGRWTGEWGALRERWAVELGAETQCLLGPLLHGQQIWDRVLMLKTIRMAIQSLTHDIWMCPITLSRKLQFETYGVCICDLAKARRQVICSINLTTCGRFHTWSQLPLIIKLIYIYSCKDMQGQREWTYVFGNEICQWFPAAETWASTELDEKKFEFRSPIWDSLASALDHLFLSVLYFPKVDRTGGLPEYIFIYSHKNLIPSFVFRFGKHTKTH